MKKFIALLLAAIMVMAMGATAFADGIVKPSGEITTTATASGIESGRAVYAYQIVEGDYNDYGIIGYKKSNDSLKINDVMNPTAEEVLVISSSCNEINSLSLERIKMEENTGTAGTYTADLSAGYWVVMVEDAVDTVYNPMLIGVYYKNGSDKDGMTSGEVKATDEWKLATEGATLAKSSKPELVKTIISDNGSEAASDKGGDVAFGGTVTFQVVATVPAYGSEYTDITYELADSLSPGLVLDTSSIEVTVGTGTDFTKYVSVIKGTDYTESNVTTAGYTLVFVDDWVRTHGNQQIVVTYSAKLTDAKDNEGNYLANTNAVPNTNDVTLTYSNNPQNNESYNTLKDKTYTYSFELDGSVFGRYESSSGGEWDEITHELIKTDDGETVSVITDEEKHYLPMNSAEVSNALKGAEFTLTSKTDPDKKYTATTTEDGYMNFVGLDAGEYTLVETKAPAGYSVNEKEIKVEIKASYDEEGKLTSYEIWIDGTKTNTYNVSYDGIGEMTYQKLPTVEHIVTNEDLDGATIIKNTLLSALPSTGGVGTTIFTIGGVILMVGAAGVYFVSRRKKNA